MNKIIYFITLQVSFLQCVSQKTPSNHMVSRINSPMTIDANWDKPVWNGIEGIVLQNYMGEKPAHFPTVHAKLAYDDENIYIIWKVDDQYIRAVAEADQGPVFRDSCVEFFFIPDDLDGTEYFNLEMNCGGTMLFHHQDFKKEGSVNISTDDIGQMKVAHSMPRLIKKEIQEETTWYLEYAIPFAILTNYYHLESPKSGTVWRANLYKCADDTSQPHWLTWSKVDYPEPRFHLPEFFGTLVFE